MFATPILVMGEAIVDEFHDGSVAGGAPFNVARSLAALGVPVRFASRIGASDDAGAQVLASASRYGLSVEGIQRDPVRPTGRVSVVEDGCGGHRFDIHPGAAWDFMERIYVGPGITYFGSLAQRSPVSRATIRAAVKQSTGLRFLDLNLRSGYTNSGLAAESLMLADWVKLNEDELRYLHDLFEPSVSGLMARFGLVGLVLTRGALGYVMYGEGGRRLVAGDGLEQSAFVDSVGAGDAFTAMLLAGLTLGRDLGAALDLANRYAAMICGVRGPLPNLGANALLPWREALYALPIEDVHP